MNQAPDGAEENFLRRDFSVAPAGAFSVVNLNPQLALWATGVRCSAAWGWAITGRGIYAASTPTWFRMFHHPEVLKIEAA
jgi:hypothetical protein